MDNAALFSSDICIYWHGIFMGAAILAAVLTSLIICAAMQRQRVLGLLSTMLAAIPLGIVFARILYCISNYEEFKNPLNIFKLTDGGYALYGAILGVFLASAVTYIQNTDCKIAPACDCMAFGGVLGIIIGRMSAYFSYDNIGIVLKTPAYQFFPLAVYDSADDKWYLATFTMEAAVEAVIFMVLCVAFIRNNHEKKGMRGRHGDIALLFLMMHGAAEAVLDSMHTDALRFPGNSFVLLQQIIAAVCFAAVMVVFVVRSIKQNGFRHYHLILSVLTAGMIGIATYMEFDRISDTNYLKNHSIMFVALLCGVVMCIFMYKTTLNHAEPAVSDNAA